MKVGASVLYPLSKGSGHVAGESTWCRSADIGTPNCVAHVGEVTPSIGEEGVYGRCWEVQDGDTLIQCPLEDICVVVCLFGNGSFVHHHGFWILLRVVMSSPFILYLHPIPDLISVQHY